MSSLHRQPVGNGEDNRERSRQAKNNGELTDGEGIRALGCGVNALLRCNANEIAVLRRNTLLRRGGEG